MYSLKDTIVAVSSPTPDSRVILRISGDSVTELLRDVFDVPVEKCRRGLVRGRVFVDDELKMEAELYLFAAPHSYTGETLAEIHVCTNSSITETLIKRLLRDGVRIAQPGEFTARAYLNGKIDLVQAEAVNEIITSSNEYQLNAAEKLLSGRLGETTSKAASEIMDCISLIEAGLDFSGEDIEFATQQEIIEGLIGIKEHLERLLDGSISCEAAVGLPAVGIAGAPNAGKSSLLNKLLGQTRSIVSEQRKTTRDVLSGLLELPHCKCVLFDCAGLMLQPESVIDRLAVDAAVEALQNSSAVVFCVDVSKADWSEDVSIYDFIRSKSPIQVATKSDLLSEKLSAEKIAKLNELFGGEFTAISVRNGAGIRQLQDRINEGIIRMSRCSTALFSPLSEAGAALTARHRQAVTETVGNIGESADELRAGNEEVAAMLLRTAYQTICNVGRQNTDEQILQNIFARFCIGK